MKNTKQKELILNIINNNYNHLSADEIYKECQKTIPNISLGTVYRNLNNLVKEQKIKRIKTVDNIDRFDHINEHSHFICVKCGKIIDIYEKLLTKMPDLENSKIIDYSITFNGICEKCREE